MGHTPNPDIRIAKSLVDYIFRWLGLTFLPGYREATGLPDSGAEEVSPSLDRQKQKLPRREIQCRETRRAQAEYDCVS